MKRDNPGGGGDVVGLCNYRKGKKNRNDSHLLQWQKTEADVYSCSYHNSIVNTLLPFLLSELSGLNDDA